ncbi:response regulator [Tenacibaculum halocynthiae]|uniref:response regulator transcription factor n=1 Tax=Tenacibaculum halocynthiae TaxID=1254437 RepID=UPI003D65CA1F
MIEKVNILIVDDHKMFLEGIQSILQKSPIIKNIHVATNGEEALKTLKHTNFDIVISDIDMPSMDGIELTQKITHIHNNIKIIIVSSHANGETITKAIKKGANGYLLKNTGKTELFKAIETVISGQNYFSNNIKEIISNSIFNPIKTKKQSVKLSSRENEVLLLISQEKNTQEIANELFISFNTVETHRKNLIRKIGTKNMVGLVKYAIQQGLVN